MKISCQKWKFPVGNSHTPTAKKTPWFVPSLKLNLASHIFHWKEGLGLKEMVASNSARSSEWRDIECKEKCCLVAAHQQPEDTSRKTIGYHRIKITRPLSHIVMGNGKWVERCRSVLLSLHGLWVQNSSASTNSKVSPKIYPGENPQAGSWGQSELFLWNN